LAPQDILVKYRLTGNLRVRGGTSASTPLMLDSRSIPFSILFAYEPEVYASSNYNLMRNATRFVDADATTKTMVYRGSMYAELSRRHWPNQLLDLRGRFI
jgi:hypothetical protein